ncbi:LysR family transcriptional regulator [Salmonella enterica]|nr:LysR family transcriptional regulator [Salmonella enterica]
MSERSNIKGPRVDYNQLKVIQAITATASVAKAAELLGVTPSAISQTLAKMRHTFKDPLFIWKDKIMLPTLRAAELSEKISPLMDTLEEIYQDAVGDPQHIKYKGNLFLSFLMMWSNIFCLVSKQKYYWPKTLR